jgi:hypothetical protein
MKRNVDDRRGALPGTGPGKCKKEETHQEIVDHQRNDLGRHRQGSAEEVVKELRRYSHQSRNGDLEGKGCFLGCRKH